MRVVLPGGVGRTRRPDKAKPPSGRFFAPTQKGHPCGWPSALFDAWQFMVGVLPATLLAVASQRSNPLPADLSCSGERSPTNNR
ncbi:hypothetical protein D782_0723 [Enterobacteriaceae bacterium strain FGI 57]|nr:hypothetical protein D782_0723 [Enterobacteriaceae bacterium strain FGI 57]